MLTHQVFIASHGADFQFLEPCLQSLNRFCGPEWLPPIVAVPDDDTPALWAMRDRVGKFEVRRRPTRAGLDKMAAQLAMLRSDQQSDADFIWLLGSDSFCTGPLKPEDFFREGRPVLMCSKYEDLATCHPDCWHWRPGTEALLKMTSPLETMRRLPLVYPRALFNYLRRDLELVNAGRFDDILYDRWAAHQDVSESNLLGTLASHHYGDLFKWVDVGCWLNHSPLKEWPNPVCTFWSHGGLDRPCDLNFEIDGRSILGRTPREIISHVLNNSSSKT